MSEVKMPEKHRPVHLQDCAPLLACQGVNDTLEGHPPPPVTGNFFAFEFYYFVLMSHQ